MSKKGVMIAAAVAAAVILGGCAKEQPMPQGPMGSQSGPSSKLGKLGHTCGGHHCKGHYCKRHHCRYKKTQ